MKSGTNLKSKYKGFSLMEMIVAIFVFSLLMTTMVSTFVSVVSVRKKARMLQQDTENARFAIEQMSKTLRTSTVLNPIDRTPVQNLQFFDYSRNSCLEYNFSSPKLQSRAGTWTNSGTPEVTPICNFSSSYSDMISGSLNSANFFVVKSASVPVARVTISLHICYNNVCTGEAGDEVAIQSAVSLRDYQEVAP
ncbi:MAG: prepilin-type N-terminal cleavage/methylation domain-containing protein [Candidatus Moranbacteria bacterium]|nr:prepilin-type N-terminal cleavage/methylation domain-containing protein [Candidatus Moranbacteria bacterium]